MKIYIDDDVISCYNYKQSENSSLKNGGPGQVLTYHQGRLAKNKICIK